MKNSKKMIWLMVMLFMCLNMYNCSNSHEEEQEEELIEYKEFNEPTEIAQRVFTCHSFTVGSSFLGISTKVYYCCLGDTLCGGPVLLGCACGFVSESTYNEISEFGRNQEFTNRINVREFIKDFNQKTFNISHSSSIKIEDTEYSIKCKDYEVDKNGYITLELQKN